MTQPVNWRIGTIGFGYKEWAGVFYPKGLPASEYLAYYAKCFNCVELDTTFHGMPAAERVQKWASAVGEDFRFAVKTYRDISHAENVGEMTSLFHAFLDPLQHFEHKLGTVLIQFPKEFTAARWRELQELCHDVPTHIPLSVEFRDASWWQSPNTQSFLTDLGVTWSVSDPKGIPATELPRATTGLSYTRLIGIHDAYPDKNREVTDRTAGLETWLAALRPMPTRDRWIVIGNDYAGYAIATVERLKARLDLPTDRPLAAVPTLFG